MLSLTSEVGEGFVHGILPTAAPGICKESDGTLLLENPKLQTASLLLDNLE